jgi:hypothetical protein
MNRRVKKSEALGPMMGARMTAGDCRKVGKILKATGWTEAQYVRRAIRLQLERDLNDPGQLSSIATFVNHADDVSKSTC